MSKKKISDFTLHNLNPAKRAEREAAILRVATRLGLPVEGMRIGLRRGKYHVHFHSLLKGFMIGKFDCIQDVK